MAPTEGMVAKPERRWGCRRGTPDIISPGKKHSWHWVTVIHTAGAGWLESTKSWLWILGTCVKFNHCLHHFNEKWWLFNITWLSSWKSAWYANKQSAWWKHWHCSVQQYTSLATLMNQHGQDKTFTDLSLWRPLLPYGYSYITVSTN